MAAGRRSRRVIEVVFFLAPLAIAGSVVADHLMRSGGLAEASGSTDPSASINSADDGVELIYQRDCAECHGGAGEGNQNGPAIADAGAGSVHYVVSTGRMPLARPDDAVQRGTPKYDDATARALARYVGGFGTGGVGIPDIDVASADIGNGGELYRLNCAACHQSVGVGGVLVDRSAPALDEATATQVGEAVRAGPLAMPEFSESALTDQGLTDLVGYVTEVLRHPENRGGWSIWHLGPVPEGAVALVGGLGSLIACALWIEGRARYRAKAAAAHAEGGDDA